MSGRNAGRVAAVIQARMTSSRLPGKVLSDLAGRPVLAWVVAAARAVPGVDDVVVATSTEESDAPVRQWCAANEIVCHAGSRDDVLARILGAARAVSADTVMRLTADCPLLDPEVCGAVLLLYRRSGCDYASNVGTDSWPDGLDCEVVSRAALEIADREAARPSDREHVTAYVADRRARFRQETLVCPLPGIAHERWTLDTPEDMAFLSRLAARLPHRRPPGYVEILHLLESEPALRRGEARPRRNEAYLGALPAGANDRHAHFAQSERLLARALKTVPVASQTFSKSYLQYPVGRAPLFATHGAGGRIWDVDGNEYVDLVCGLLPIVLGHRDPDVDAAIRAQLASGTTLSLATALECELAERLVEIIPCAEMVRFGKNGTDATSAAIRLARAFTGRDRVIACGYHGWQDWYIGATARHKGVPAAVRALTHTAPYNDLEAVRALFAEHRGEIAAVIMEPMNVAEPAPGYLEELRELVHAEGALLIFDEIITGFRFALGGAQALFGVTPDLAAFGKAMGNGMPIAAVVGRADVMREMEEIFFSGTFGGECVSLAAAIAVVDKMRREPVIESLWRTGAALAEGTAALVARHGLGEVIRLTGKPPWIVLDVRSHATARKEAVRTLLMREMLAGGVLTQGSHNVCYAHSEADVTHVLAAYDRAFATVRREVDSGQLEARLGHAAVEPIFRVR
jgi:glutamate-1-semialdehyde aminotransferase/spore coat polysaccharide biosynthesis protein SpsF (cytidylyltransferase family)